MKCTALKVETKITKKSTIEQNTKEELCESLKLSKPLSLVNKVDR